MCRFDIPVVDVLRLLLPDLVVLIPSVAALIVTSYILRAYKKRAEPLPAWEGEGVEGALAEESVAERKVIALQEEQHGMLVCALSSNFVCLFVLGEGFMMSLESYDSSCL